MGSLYIPDSQGEPCLHWRFSPQEVVALFFPFSFFFIVLFCFSFQQDWISWLDLLELIYSSARKINSSVEWEQAGKQQIQCRQNSLAFNSNLFGGAESPTQGFSKLGITGRESRKTQ